MFLDILENFILYQDKGGPHIKIMAKNHQYLGVNNTIESFQKVKENNGKLGVFWHTQGSGKSFSMIFFSQKIHRKFPGNYTFVVVTDRKELDDQIYKNFLSTGAVTEQEVHAESRENLKQLLRENHRNIFTLIHKFGTEAGEEFPLLSERSDIIVITDEAHRTQYDTLAMNMRKALPNASFIAFTGTPLIVGEERTKHTFGDYISIYNFKQSVDDNATVPLYYEIRIPEVQLQNEHFTEDFERIVEESVLDEEQEKKLEREFSRQYHIITRDDRLETIAEDVVSHFINRGYQGKAMVVSIDKPTAVKMYDKVRNHWKRYIEKLGKDLEKIKDIVKKEEIKNTIKYMKETDMAVVVSGEQNEVERFNKLGLNILTHRKRMVKEDLAKKFKDPEDPFRIVFVCAMWMTGFDVQPLSTIYLDKPMKNHTLMQTIARANRVFRDKPNGLIVDYVGIFRDLQKALAIYGTSSGGGIEPGDSPVRPKEDLIKELREAIEETRAFGKERNIDLELILKAESFHKIKSFDDAVDAILVEEDSKRKYISLANNVRKLFKAILPDPVAGNYKEISDLINIIAEKIRSISPDVDIEEVIEKVEDLLDRSIKPKGYVIRDSWKPSGSEYIDLSTFNFEELKKRFIQSRKHIEVEKLKGAINARLRRLVRLNKLRINLLEKLNELIEEYNSGATNIEVFFDKLLVLAKELNEEEKRGISENLSEEELAVFDLLYKPDLSENEKKQVKLAAKHLLEVLKKEKFVLDWRKRQQSRATVLITIRDMLDKELPRSYTPEIYQQRCDLVYHHIYDSYYGMGKSVYASFM
jgi:type I restriction enzyme R subunit